MKVTLKMAVIPAEMRPIIGARIIEESRRLSFSSRMDEMKFEVNEFVQVCRIFYRSFADMSKQSCRVAMDMKYPVKVESESGRVVEFYIWVSDDYKGIHYGYSREVKPSCRIS